MAHPPLPGFEAVEKLEKVWKGKNPAAKPNKWQPYVTTFAAINVAFLLLDPWQTLRNWALLSFFAPLWVPIILYKFTFLRFWQYKKAENISKLKTVLLELRMPRDTQKTPLAMETIISSFHFGSGEGTSYAKYFQGGTRPWFSFEIASLGGQVRFYVWTRENLRRGIESFFYAQYPGIEIIEAEDYSRMFDPADPENVVWGDEIVNTKDDAIPIKTYVDYGLDKAGAKPEEQVDPLNQMLEFFGSIGPREQVWLQYVFRMTKSEKFAGKKNAKGEDYTWKDQAKDFIKGIREAAVKDAVVINTEEREGTYATNLTPGQTDMVKAIERNISKPGFDVGIRVLYTAPKNDAKVGQMAGQLLTGIFKPFSSEAYNGFKPAAQFDAKFQGYPWEDRKGTFKEQLHHELVEVYRRRAFFHEPYIGNWSIMSSEELATLFHVPSATVSTPGLPRIQSTTKAPPSNLPV